MQIWFQSAHKGLKCANFRLKSYIYQQIPIMLSKNSCDHTATLKRCWYVMSCCIKIVHCLPKTLNGDKSNHSIKINSNGYRSEDYQLWVNNRSTYQWLSLVHDFGNSGINALDLQQFSTKPLILYMSLRVCEHCYSQPSHSLPLSCRKLQTLGGNLQRFTSPLMDFQHVRWRLETGQTVCHPPTSEVQFSHHKFRITRMCPT